MNLGICLSVLREYEKAKKFLDVEAQDLSIDYRLKKNRLLASYYDRTQNYEDAIFYYKRNQRLRDSLELNESSILKKQLVALVANEEIENSQQLIEEQKSANERIRSEIQAKDERINLVFISLVFTLLGFAGLVYAYLKSIKNQRLIAQQKHIIEKYHFLFYLLIVQKNGSIMVMDKQLFKIMYLQIILKESFI